MVHVVLSFALLSGVDAQPPLAWKKANDKALRLYGKGELGKAADAFKKALALASGDVSAETETRKFLVLSLLGGNRRDSAIDVYRELLLANPGFQWNPDEILPEDLAYLNAALGQRQARAQEGTKTTTAPSNVPSSAPSNMPDAPRAVVVQTTPPPTNVRAWHWYYLAPLGIGQFLAGSPVRGAVFATLQVAAVVANVVGFALYSRELLVDGTARNAQAAQTGQTLMNVGFFSILGSVIAGTVDGAAFEP